MIFISIILFLIGLALLAKSSDFLVDGAASIAKKLKISSIVIGLTIVAFGTSAPELLVSLTSAIQGSTEIAVGNIVGSNIANILLILGVSGIIYPVSVSRNTIWKEIPLSFIAAVILVVLGIESFFSDLNFNQLDLTTTNEIGILTRSEGIILLIFFIIFLYYSFGIAQISTQEPEESISELPLTRSIVYFVGGLIVLTLSSRLVVDSALSIASAFSLSEDLTGLTIVAVGTSLPELSASVTAALKKQSDIAVGNVVGSNIFNIFFILGTTLLFSPISLSGQNVADIIILLVVTLIFFLSIFVFTRRNIGKFEGFSFVVFYILYIVYLIQRG